MKRVSIEQIIAEALGCKKEDVISVQAVKRGMTNRSFLFELDGGKYIVRIPGEGTDKLIDRKQEAVVFEKIKGLSLCNEPIYINPESGIKITKYLEGIRVCDPLNVNDLLRCMKLLKWFHGLRLVVDHSFDIFSQIEFYESLRKPAASIYPDYLDTKEKVFSLRKYIDRLEKEKCLTHIDAVPDNFLFQGLPDGSENLQLIDWEYAGMQDPHVDIAMFCVYSLYDKAACDRLIDIYFEGKCSEEVRTKIYCYIAMSGLLWSNWCEYKSKLGVEFGTYSVEQYRFAKDYYGYAKARIGEV